jgi:germination protein YpeB
MQKEGKDMTRKRKIQVITLTAAVILILGGTTASGYLLAAKYRTNLEYSYRRALSDLGDYVSGMETTLNKAVYANTAPQQNGIAARLMRDSSGAKAALSALPLKGDEFDNMSKFIAQVGDFSTALCNKVSSGGKISTDEFKTIRGLGEYAKNLEQGLSDVQQEFSDGTVRIGETESLVKNMKSTQPVFSDRMETVAKDFENYPKLIYDGPFSDHVGQKTPKLTEGKAEVKQGNAQNTAAQFLGVKESGLKHAGDTGGGLPTYNFTSGDIWISVTKKAGFPVKLTDPRQIGEAKLGYQDALQKSKEFLNAHNLPDMKESYYVIHDGKCTINYACTKDGVVYYPDLIKVSVALDNGGIVDFDATGYVMNHVGRKKPEVKLTQAEAQKSVSPYLTVKKGELAVIPTPGLTEVTCYEFLCESKVEKNQQVLVYIDAATGYEQDILILLFSDNGVLTK